MLFQVHDHGVEAVETTTMLGEDLYEKHFEDWVEQRSALLGEELLIVGRQVELDDGKDRIDLLALDKSGRLVVIELKRDLVGGAADLQPLRYAALVSTWSHEQLRRQAEGYWSTSQQTRGTFAQEIEQFCDEEAQVNSDQRVILAGRDLTPRLGTVALWLRAHGIDTTVVTVSVFKQNETLLLQPQVVIPIPSETAVSGPVSVGDSSKPWKIDSQEWHLEQRLSPKGRAIAEQVIQVIAESVPAASGPYWQQKHYVSWVSNTSSRHWLHLYTNSPHQVSLIFPASDASGSEIAIELGWHLFDGDASLAEKLAMGSSAGRNSKDFLRLVVKVLDDVSGDQEKAFANVLTDLWEEFASAASS
ncbi:MAG TPA: hypothetical protein VGN51_13875 [Acidimicrobiia bacterium]|jgi:hypothetical protein